MKKICCKTFFKTFMLVVAINFLAEIPTDAADMIAPNWNLNNIETQTRRLTTNYSGTGAVIGGGSRHGDAKNNILTIDGLSVSSQDSPQTTYDNGADFVAGGAVYQATATNNKLQLTNSTLQGRTAIGGAAFLDTLDNRLGAGSANNNTVSVTGSSVIYSSTPVTYTKWDWDSLSYVSDTKLLGGDVVGGYANYANGTANQNTVVIDNSNVAGTVYGAKVSWQPIYGIDYDLDNHTWLVDFDLKANYNTVQVRNGSVVGTVYGSDGTDSSTGNTVIIDNSTVNSVYGAGGGWGHYQSGSTSAAETHTNHTVIVQNGSTVANAYAVNAKSANASANTLRIDNSTVSNGSLYTTRVGLAFTAGDSPAPINATVLRNRLEVSNISGAVTAREVSAGLNLSGTSNSNTVVLDNVADLTVNRGLYSFTTLNFAELSAQNLVGIKSVYSTYTVTSVDNFNASYGFIYGGGALDYTQQTNDNTVPPALSGGALPANAGEVPEQEIIANGGTNADGNTVYIANSNIRANVMGGMAGQFEEINYTTWSYSEGNYIKTVTKKTGNEIVVTTYNCGPSGTACDAGTSGAPTAESAFNDKVFSASNNTVILENTAFDGVIYGGFVAGADLKADHVQTSNNTVILRGNTTLSSTSQVFGGSSYFGRSTNKLVFDRMAAADGSYITFSNRNQFQNFNDIWYVNADLDTRLNFDFNNVNALVNVDASETREGAAVILKTQTTVDLSDVEQNGVITDLIDTSVELTHNKIGIYSYSLTGQKEDATTVGWKLTSMRDHDNVEIYGQLPLVGLVLAAQGPDLLSRTFTEAWQSDSESNVFLNGGYNHTRYTTGSGFDLNSGLGQVGLWKKWNDMAMGGFFVKYAGGSYKTFPIKATGDAHVFGGGLMGSLRYSDTGRLEASVEGGHMDMKFSSDELVSTMQSGGMYLGASAGFVEKPSEAWEVFSNLSYLRKNGDDITDNLTQTIHYDPMQSIVLQGGTNYTLTSVNWGGLVPSFGASALYEFDGKSNVCVLGTNNNSASLRGFSGRGEIGFSYTSEDEMFLPVISKLTVFGMVGKRQGVGGEINISFMF